MPRGRMLDKRISESKKLGSVSDKSKVIYFMLLPHLDKNGCFKCVPGLIKWTTMPNIDYDFKTMDKCLRELNEAKLLIIYNVNGDEYLQYIKFREFQTNDVSKEGITDIPEPTPDLLQTYSKPTPDLLQTQVKDKEQDKDKGKGEDKRSAFKKPTREQLTDYMNEKLIYIDIDAFLDYYESNGWKVGRNAMKDWKATVRRWAKNTQPDDGLTKAQRATMKSIEEL